jgi:pilus assembly protein CpaB
MGISMAIGLVISGSCTYFLSRKISSRGTAQPVEQKYIAPTRFVKSGEILKADDLETVSWPANTPIADAFSKPEAVIGRAVLYPISKGQPITGQFLSAAGSGAGLAGKIPDGMRAIALRSDEVVGVAGFLLPDSHVDVLATIHTEKMPEPTTFVVLQNAQVLAAGRQLEPDPEGKPAVVTVLTLLLSPTDAERAVLASLQGTIHFILRSGSDTGTPDSPSLDVGQLIGRTSDPEVKIPATPHRVLKVVDVKPPAPTLTVETIAGEKQTTDTFKVGQP